MTRRTGWLLVIALAAAAALAPMPPAGVERWYSRAVFPALQHTLTGISNLVPFALFDAIWIGAVAAALVLLRRRVRADGWRCGLQRSAVTLLRVASLAYLLFLVTWGLNYRRLPMTAKVVFRPERITRAASGALADWAVAEMNAQYPGAHASPMSADALRAAFDQVHAALGGRPIVPGRPKQTLLGWYFHNASISGMTDPFLLETMLAPDLLDVERPFVVAHEWAHLAGYADESEANFVAYLACRRGDAPARYSGALAMIGYAADGDSLRRLDPGPRSDLYAIRMRYARTSAVLRAAARQGYDKYLKANRVERGVESYDAVVQLILGTEVDERGNPRLR